MTQLISDFGLKIAEFQIVDCRLRLPIVDWHCGLRIADCGLSIGIADCGLRIADFATPIS